MRFTEKLNTKLDDLAKQTAKSYQAAQHLFFDSVESIFNDLKELNKLVKDFKEEVRKDKIDEVTVIRSLISDLHESIETKKFLEGKISELEKDIEQRKKDLSDVKTKHAKLGASDAKKEFDQLSEEKWKIESEFKQVDQEVFSFFSKLSKPLKKYQRIAMDEKVLGTYVDDSTSAFWKDGDLDILSDLEGLSRSLERGSLSFDEKLTKNFMAQIEKGRSGYLKELQEKGRKLREKISEIQEKVDSSEIINEIEKFAAEVEKEKSSIERKERELIENKGKLHKIREGVVQGEIKVKIESVFRKNITFIQPAD